MLPKEMSLYYFLLNDRDAGGDPLALVFRAHHLPCSSRVNVCILGAPLAPPGSVPAPSPLPRFVYRVDRPSQIHFFEPTGLERQQVFP